MNAKEHLTIGVIVSALVFTILLLLGYIQLNLSNITIICIISVLFCLLPDIDHPISTITYFFFGSGILGMVIALINDKLSLGLPYMNFISVASLVLMVVTFIFAKFVKHRGFVHTIWFGALCAGSLYFLTGQWQHCVIAFTSFYSHLAADGLWFKF